MNQKLPRLTFEQAKRAKEAGFDWPCEYHYTHWNSPHTNGPGYLANWNDLNYDNWGKEMPYTSAPETALFLQWAREMHEMVGLVFPNPIMGNEGKWSFSIETTEKGSWGASSGVEGLFKLYSQAESALIDEILSILSK